MVIKEVTIVIVVIIIIFLVLVMYASGKLNEEIDSSLYRNERLDYYCANDLMANVRYIGNTIYSPFKIRHNDYLSVYLSQDENGFVYIRFLNEYSFVYACKENFFMEWRLLYDDEF